MLQASQVGRRRLHFIWNGESMANCRVDDAERTFRLRHDLQFIDSLGKSESTRRVGSRSIPICGRDMSVGTVGRMKAMIN
jgi:hypothetical protein